MMSNQRPDWKAGIYREFMYQLEQGYARAADTRLFLTQAPLEQRRCRGGTGGEWVETRPASMANLASKRQRDDVSAYFQSAADALSSSGPLQ